MLSSKKDWVETVFQAVKAGVSVVLQFKISTASNRKNREKG